MMNMNMNPGMPEEALSVDTNSLPPDEDLEEDRAEAELDRLLNSTNLVDIILKKKEGKEKLVQIGQEVIEGYMRDKESRKHWETQNEEWTKLALQVMEKKNYPWDNASNVKFPILTTAALQFSSRAYPSLVSSFDIVKAKAIGNDPGGKFQEVADRISTHMSYQVLYEMLGWDEDMDKLCFILPIVGTAFKKTYYDGNKGTNCSELVFAKDLVVNYWAKNLNTAYRVSHKLWRTPNDIVERQRKGLFTKNEDYLKDAGLDRGGNIDAVSEAKKTVTNEASPPAPDKSTPRLLVECHTFYDLDDDGYDEPYVITIDYETRLPLRIVARFYKEDVELDEKDEKKIAKITPCQYFTKFGFIPNPDGGFYDLGFGLLLGGINESVNTLINQLVDSGTINNLQGGFIGKGIRINQKSMRFTPGEWKAVNNFGDDLRKGIFPLPTKEPSNVLFQLLGVLVQSGKELASISEIFTGKMPGQNTPASTTMATIEQGLKVFTSIYKRLYRSLGEEFEKLYKLNKLYLPEHIEYTVEVEGEAVPQTTGKQDYIQMNNSPQPGKPFVKIVPAADPNMVSDTQKLVKSQGLLELIQLGTINRAEATKQILEQQGQTNIAELTKVPEPQPDFETQLKGKIHEDTMQLEKAKLQLEAFKAKNESLERETKAMLNMAQLQGMKDEAQLAALQAQTEMLAKDEENMRKQIQSMLDHSMQMNQQQEKHQQQLQQKEEAHKLQMQMKAAAKPTE